jgi:ribosomal protein L7/L12
MPQWAVYLRQVPPAGNPIARLLGANPRAPLLKAIQSLTALPTARAKAILEKAPGQVARFATEQEARVAVQTLEDAGARCEIRTVD